MNSFQDYQVDATKLPVSLRNNRDRILFTISGLQEEAGKIGSLLEAVVAPTKFELTTGQQSELKDRLADTLWYIALLCHESGLTLQEIATHSLNQLKARREVLDPEAR